jgi:hypothetical protein
MVFILTTGMSQIEEIDAAQLTSTGRGSYV